MLWALKEAPTEGPTETLILIALADYAGAKDSPWVGACPSHKTIAEAAQVTTRTVRRCLGDLERRGLIKRGDQSVTDKFRPDRRPVVWDLNGHLKRATGGQDVRPDTVSARTNGASRGDTAMSYDPSLIDPSLKGASDAPSSDAPKRNDYPADFEEFWKHYPSRGKHPNPKKPAFSKWKTAIKTADADTLIAAVKAYAASELPDDRQMIPQASTWLHQERWTEQDTTPPDEWLRDCWRTGNTGAVTERTGLVYSGVVWPDEIPTDPDAKNQIRLAQARAWITENHDRIVGRMNHAA